MLVGRRAQTRMRLLGLAALVTLAATGAACGDDGGEGDASSEPVTVTEAAAGSSVSLSVGDELQVVLSGNPTTGYSWEVSPQSAAPVELQGEAVFDPESTLLGAPGAVTLLFEATEAGDGPLVLDYRRPFEEGTPPERTFEISVTVE